MAFVATALRFMPRDAAGSRRLPRIIDQSVGVYLIRRLLGSNVEVAEESELLDEPPPPVVPARAGLGAGFGAWFGRAGAPKPTMPSRFVVSRSSDRGRLVARAVFAGSMTAGSPGIRGARTRPASGLAMQRRIAGAVALATVIVAVLGVAIGPRTLDGAVLSATGTPGAGASRALSDAGNQPTDVVDGSASPDASVVAGFETPSEAPAATPPAVTGGSGGKPRSTPAPGRTAKPTIRPPAAQPTPPPPAVTLAPRPTRPPTPSLAPTETPKPTPLPPPPTPTIAPPPTPIPTLAATPPPPGP